MNEGRIFLVGLGPGAAEHMSGRARQAIEESDVVIGYARYIDLVKDLLAGKEVIRKPMTQEVDRCIVACERARKGRTVALVSSGDSGVYGMAGLTYEVLLQSGWTPGEGIGVEVIPGITALSACASLVGAPLGHDFCAISLSDLLTPWPIITRRLEASGRGDFVIALYNPRSGRRQEQLVEARHILLRDRRPETPVAIVHAAYRGQQAVRLTTLDEMANCEIGMLSTVLIGNRSTYCEAGLMITPRGYARKYLGLTGEVTAGERSGHSLSMGLTGWKACVREHLRTAQTHSPEDVARHFDTSIGEILAAIGAADNSETGDYTAAAVIAGAEAAVLDAVKDWGRIRIAVAGATEALCEVLMNAGGLVRRGKRICLESTDLRLSIDGSHIRRGWFVSWGRRSRGVYFVDTAGKGILKISLRCDDEGRFDPSALENYERTRRRVSARRLRYVLGFCDDPA